MRVIIADDSTLLREGVARILAEAGIEVVGQAGDAEELLRMVDDDPPDAVVVDIRMPPTQTDEGIRAAHRIRESHPEIGVLVLSQYLQTVYAEKLLEHGAEGLGYLLKDRVTDLSQFAEAIRRVSAGETVVDPEIVGRLVGRRREDDPLERLTQREREVLALMAEGRSNPAIAELLFMGLKTVETHVGRIFTKLGLEPTTDDHRRVLAVLAHLRS
jgi:DNA-binding NarL/FixJ family response regulator